MGPLATSLFFRKIMHKKTLEKFEAARPLIKARRILVKARLKIQNVQTKARLRAIKEGTHIRKHILYPGEERLEAERLTQKAKL